MSALRRHDLVWLDPAFPLAKLGVTEDHRAELGGWIARGLPLVVGRQFGQPGVRLGFTLPGIGPRRRVEVRAPQSAIVAHEPPPALESVVRAAPEAWREPLHAIAHAFHDAGLLARAYGSLVTQAVTGEACVRPGSDVDLLVDCAGPNETQVALAILSTCGDRPPRLDGELRMLNGWAVAWRELATTLAAGGQLLAKSDDDVCLMSADGFLLTQETTVRAAPIEARPAPFDEFIA
ncbi:MAG TPA: malonate decarboxylase holo-[acyl-carrier-protein] synthase [Aromatoleum sp.]|uniref:malonate decarboxylase holo-[acyl-carrier-protein] synthase n=1 Tax=Aromatoleum sp. TaxID=2307007 RepID=UPI002B46F627|nr:malonate decarboxylase holo-[acyl-carrier-protein] synthase [Aromatoleum sp.]HJV27339.1 malonate decarboxylase holo-[acyl-carrier-protein] synthase [Aromatoleum sp.]